MPHQLTYIDGMTEPVAYRGHAGSSRATGRRSRMASSSSLSAGSSRFGKAATSTSISKTSCAGLRRRTSMASRPVGSSPADRRRFVRRLELRRVVESSQPGRHRRDAGEFHAAPRSLPAPARDGRGWRRGSWKRPGEARAATESLAGVTFGEALGHREAAPSADAPRVGAAPWRNRRTPTRSGLARMHRIPRRRRCTRWPASGRVARTGSNRRNQRNSCRPAADRMKDFLQSITAWPESWRPRRQVVQPIPGRNSWAIRRRGCSSTPTSRPPDDLEHAMPPSDGKPLQHRLCPSHARGVRLQRYPLETFLDAGCLVGLGTDSLASNPDLDVCNEAKFVAERSPASPGGECILRMLTLDGAGNCSGCRRRVRLHPRLGKRPASSNW